MTISEKFFNWVENETHTVPALIGGCVLLIAGFIASDNFLSKYSSSDHLKLAYLLVFAVWIVYWFFNRLWIPKCKPNKVGLILCIYADTTQAERALKKDFLLSIKKQIANEGLDATFEILVIKNHLSQKFNDSSLIKKLHKKTCGCIYIFGEVKKRKDGVDKYFLSLDGMVLHRPIPQNVSNELSRDFLATLPKAINFNDEFSFRGFRISSDIVLKSVKYIVGIAAYLSGDPRLAIKLHEMLKNEISALPEKTPFDQTILSKIDLLLSSEYAMLALYYFAKSDQTNARNNLATAFSIDQRCYRALILDAIIAFAWDNDPERALAVTKKCHGFNMPEWRYNEAFLHFWIGNLATAWRACEKIKNCAGDQLTSLEVIQFNEQLLRTVNKPILYFWLGFNYYFKQSNLPLALWNLEIFEQKADASMDKLKQKSSAWLTEIKRNMAIN